MPLMLNLRTKYWFYEKANQVICMIWRNDEEAVNIVKKSKGLRVYDEVQLPDDMTDDVPEIVDIRLSKDEQESQENSVYVVVFFISLFLSISFNFFFQKFLQEILNDSIEGIILLSDSVGIDTHFIRYLYLALFETRLVHVYNSYKVLKDCFIYFFVIIPMFLLGLRFWTAPVYLKYTVRLNSFVVPLALPIVFFSEHLDMMLLGGLCGLMNIYVFWYHVDPPQPSYSSGRYSRYRGDDSDEGMDSNYNSRRRNIDFAEAARYGLSGLAGGLPVNPYGAMYTT